MCERDGRNEHAYFLLSLSPSTAVTSAMFVSLRAERTATAHAPQKRDDFVVRLREIRATALHISKRSTCHVLYHVQQLVG